MGGGSYDRDVGSTYTSPSFGSHAAYTSAADYAMDRGSLDTDLVPKGRTLVCSNQSPIVLAMDVTGSMGDWSKIIYDKMPMLFGQIIMQGYLPDPAISFAAVGDAYGDLAPIQICDFAGGDELDNWLTRLWLEGEGQGGARESYTLAAYAYLQLASYTNLLDKPYFFFTGDEGFYESLNSEEIRQYVGGTAKSVSSLDILNQLMDQYHVFLIHKRYYDPTAESRIIRQWKEVLGDERVIPLQDPKAVADAILGAIALQSGSRTLDDYKVDLLERGQSKERIAEVTAGLSGLSKSSSLVPVNTTGVLPPSSGAKRTSGKTRRL